MSTCAPRLLIAFADRYIDNVSAEQVLDKGLQDLMDMCDVIEEEFKEARDEHNNRMEE
jgi:DNA-directed RNA polymerase I and III subunit RPAC2